jgi:hypothetical protein
MSHPAESPVTDLQAIARVVKVDGPVIALERIAREMQVAVHRAGNRGDQVGARVLLEEVKLIERCYREIERRRKGGR